MSTSRRLNVSRIFYNERLPALTKSHSSDFVPFIHERDKMGRLIGSEHPPKRYSCGAALTESIRFPEKGLSEC